ncbi:hypothetical protein [Phenylobacterium sp.]
MRRSRATLEAVRAARVYAERAQRHDTDVDHCKACGELLNIPNDDTC